MNESLTHILMSEAGLDEKQAKTAGTIITSGPLAGRRRWREITSSLQNELGVSAEKADEIYELAAEELFARPAAVLIGVTGVFVALNLLVSSVFLLVKSINDRS